MQKPKCSKSRLALKIAGQVQLRKGPSKHGALVLDDFLSTLDAIRKAYKLPEAKFGLKQIEHQPGANMAVETIITSSLARHAPSIYAKSNPLPG